MNRLYLWEAPPSCLVYPITFHVTWLFGHLKTEIKKWFFLSLSIIETFWLIRYQQCTLFLTNILSYVKKKTTIFNYFSIQNHLMFTLDISCRQYSVTGAASLSFGNYFGYIMLYVDAELIFLADNGTVWLQIKVT